MEDISIRQKKKNESDGKILRSAIRAFGSKGYYSTSLTEVAAGAGISQSLVSQRFGSKENLFLTVYGSVSESLCAACANHSDVPEILYDVIDWIKDLRVSDPETFEFFVTFSGSVDVPESFVGLPDKLFVNGGFVNAVKRAQDEGVLDAGNPSDLFRMFFSSTASLVDWYYKASLQTPDYAFFIAPLRTHCTEPVKNTPAPEKAAVKAAVNSGVSVDERRADGDAVTGFLFNISRDIRIPMSAVIGFNEVARKHIDDRQKVLDCLDKIGSAGEHILAIINNLLDMSAAESGQTKIVREEADFLALCSDIRAIGESVAGKKEIKLEFATQVMSRYVFADVTHIKRCVTALISNAVSFSDKGQTVEITVTQSGIKDDCGIFVFSVRDYGAGLSEESMKIMYDPFARLGDGDQFSGNYGIGLGLSTAKRLAEAMNGTIEAESTPGKGSTFKVTLPLHVREYIKTPNSTDTGFEGEIRRRVLLVDANAISRELTHEFLIEKRFDVEEAEDGMTAVKLLREKGPDYYSVVLIDAEMPVMDGYETASQIRKLYPNNRIPIVAVSDNASEEDRAKSREIGIDAHVTKPVRIEALYEAIIRSVSSTMKTDPLTHVKNRIAYEEACRIIDSSIRQGNCAPFALVMCDINNLKKTNDKYGHASGDALIRDASKLICSTFKLSPVYRIGGDEFAVILRGNDYENRGKLVDMLKLSCMNNLIAGEVVVACGISDFAESDKSVNDVFDRADSEMYDNKALLKNGQR